MEVINIQELIYYIPFLHLVRIILFVLFLLCSIEDIKAKQISVKKVLFTDILLTVVMFVRTDLHWMYCIAGFFIGGVFIIISKATNGQIGLGDGYVISTAGLGLGIIRCLEMLSYAFLLSSGYAIILFFRFHNKRQKIPFIPFLFVGYMFGIFFGGYAI